MDNQDLVQVLSGNKPIQVSIDDIDFVYLGAALFIGIFASLILAHMVKSML